VKTFSTQTTVRPDQKVEVEHVPFSQGQKVAVFMMSLQKDDSSSPTTNLTNSIVSFEAPFEPIAPEEWEATA
jgi:hypothetical protein